MNLRGVSVEQRGIEHETVLDVVDASTEDRDLTTLDTPPTDADEALNTDDLDRDLDRRGAVESALAKAIALAATAGRFDVVAQLARELEARRLARAGNVVSLDSARNRDRGERR